MSEIFLKPTKASAKARPSLRLFFDKYFRIDSKLYGVTTASGSFSNTTEYTYAEQEEFTSGRVESYKTTVGSVSNNYIYTYDSLGNITKVVINGATEIRYVYDDLGQLIPRG